MCVAVWLCCVWLCCVCVAVWLCVIVVVFVVGARSYVLCPFVSNCIKFSSELCCIVLYCAVLCCSVLLLYEMLCVNS